MAPKKSFTTPTVNGGRLNTGLPGNGRLDIPDVTGYRLPPRQSISRPGGQTISRPGRSPDLPNAQTKRGLLSKAGTACKNNPTICAAAATIGVTAGMATYDKYKDLEEEQQTCLRLCAPEDWDEYKTGKKNKPTYKTEDAVSPYDSAIAYAPLYEDEETAELLCTEDNLRSQGIVADKKGCETFCEEVCDYDATDVITGTASSFTSGITDGIQDLFNAVFGDVGGMIQNGLMIGCAICCCMILIFVAMKFM
jgi:hypothetical protein